MATGSNIQSKDVYLLYGDKGIILTLRATAAQYDDVLPAFNVMVESFTYGEASK